MGAKPSNSYDTYDKVDRDDHSVSIAANVENV